MEIRIIGCGAMGSAIAEVLAEHGQEVSLYDKSQTKAEELGRKIEARVCRHPLENLSSDAIVLLATKPQDFEALSSELSDLSQKLIVSIMAGVSSSQIKEAFPDCRVLRMVPNLAVRYGDGIVALAEDPEIMPFKERIEEIFSPLGLIRWIPENLCNAATALSGSGPAFVFSIIEAMVDASIAMGFTSEVGYELVKHMVGGSLTMLYESQSHPSKLKWQVASPEGTTIAGLRVFEEKAVRSGIIESFVSAYNRAKELGQ